MMIPRIELSAEERRAVQVLDEKKLLHDMKEDHFLGKEDVIAAFCSDGRWALRVIDRFREMYDEKRELCFLPVNEFGGTLVLDDDSPLLERGTEEFPCGNMADRHLIGKIRKAVKMGYRALCNINHFPCGMSREHDIHPLCIIDSLMMAKRRIKDDEYIKSVGRITVASFLQIGDIDGQMRIARIPYEDYLAWRKDNPEHASPAMQRMLASFVR